MSQYKLFPRLARRSASLLFVCSLSFTFLIATAAQSFGQSQQGRPVARLITATSEPYEAQPMQANHRVVARQPVVVASSAPVAASSLDCAIFGWPCLPDSNFHHALTAETSVFKKDRGGWRFSIARGQPLLVSLKTFTLPSFAKINWTLRVLGRRRDGFHELRTIFQT